MADPTPLNPPPPQPGFFKNAIVVNFVTTVVGALGGALVAAGNALSAQPDSRLYILAAVLPIVGALLRDPAFIKKLFGASVLVLLLAGSARADGLLVNCLSGCPKAMKAGDTQVTGTVWIGPSLGLVPALYDSASHSWEVGFHPTFGYGVGFRPYWWTATKSLVKADLFLSADFTNGGTVDVLPGVTLIDGVQIIGGPRFHFATPQNGASVSWLFGIGFATSLGAP